MGFLMKLLIPPPKRFESKAMLFVSGPKWRYSVPPSIRKINSKGTAVLNARRDGNRGKSKAQDYSGFGLKSQTPARKSAQLSRAPARAAGIRNVANGSGQARAT